MKVICAGVLILASALSLFGQGALTPPAGTPAPTMKALDQIEPRTDLRVLYDQNHDGINDDTSTEIVIAAPGSYYLSSNLDVARGKGILVEQFAGQVTIDLNGFRIARTTGTGGSGIDFTLAVGGSSVTVRNGTITGFNNGVSFTSGSSARRGGAFIDLVVSACTTTGLIAPSSWRLINCAAHDNGGTGIVTSSGCTLTNCTATKNLGVGISAGPGSTLTGCNAFFNQGTRGIQGDKGVTVSNCNAQSNSGIGIEVGERSTVTACNAAENGSQGIVTLLGSTVTSCTASRNLGNGIEVGDGAVVSKCTAYENDGHGFSLATNGMIKECAARANQGNGILIGGNGLVSDCVTNLSGKKSVPNNTLSDGVEVTGGRTRIVNTTSFSNAQHGIFSASANNRNFIEGCLLHSNSGFGIFLQAGAGDTVIKNQVGGNTGGTINISGGNIAPVQSASTAVGSMHPLANFQ